MRRSASICDPLFRQNTIEAERRHRASDNICEALRRVLSTVKTAELLYKIRKEQDGKMKVVVCIGSSCHIKGSRLVVERLQVLVAEHGVGDKVDLSGTFCLGRCAEGVCVLADGELFSVSPDTVDEFFIENVLGKLGA